MVTRIFQVQSLKYIGTNSQDLDQGVVRVSQTLLENLGGRNALVRVSIYENEKIRQSIVRLVRAATTGSHRLLANQIALQYDDRVLLGVAKAGSEAKLRIKKVNSWIGLPQFIFGHTSPVKRIEAFFGLALTCLGLVMGLLLGLIVS